MSWFADVDFLLVGSRDEADVHLVEGAGSFRRDQQGGEGRRHDHHGADFGVICDLPNTVTAFIDYLIWRVRGGSGNIT
ncbi:MAG: hypothetical protein KDA93_22450 [Planctomycetaceae bacterium]|nr:hypothetical protein [Planctomycetaceae bacterium]